MKYLTRSSILLDSSIRVHTYLIIFHFPVDYGDQAEEGIFSELIQSFI